MIKQIKVKNNTVEKERLLFDKISNLKKVNILFGGNGVGKSTFLNGIITNNLDLVSDRELVILKYINSEDNCKGYKFDNNFKDMNQALKIFNSSGYSEGQTMLNHLLPFIKNIKDVANKNKNKTIIVVLDEIDSGLSIENINLFLHLINESLNDFENIQFFISTNHYHFTYVLKDVINMYDGTWIRINSYEEYFELLNKGIQIMHTSKKRDFDFLNNY